MYATGLKFAEEIFKKAKHVEQEQSTSRLRQIQIFLGIDPMLELTLNVVSVMVSDFILAIGVDHGDDGDGEVHPDRETQRVAQKAHECEGVARAPWR